MLKSPVSIGAVIMLSTLTGCGGPMSVKTIKVGMSMDRAQAIISDAGPGAFLMAGAYYDEDGTLRGTQIVHYLLDDTTAFRLIPSKGHPPTVVRIELVRDVGGLKSDYRFESVPAVRLP